MLALPAVADALSPDIRTPGVVGPTVTPRPVRTAHSGAPGTPRIDKRRLIIEQNVNCWLGVPGATCDPGRRTYA